MTDKLNFSQIQDFQLNLADKALKEAQAELDALRAEVERLREHLKRGQTLINEMDQRMPEQATEDADGWIVSYRIPVGPWHHILGWARGGW